MGFGNIPGQLIVQSATQIRDALQTLTGANRLDASAIKNIPVGTPLLSRGVYNGGATYSLYDTVNSAGSSYWWANATPGNNAPPSADWQLIASVGAAGAGGGSSSWQLITSNYSAGASDRLLLNSTTPLIVALPTGVSNGTEIDIVPVGGSAYSASFSLAAGQRFNSILFSAGQVFRYPKNTADGSEKLIYVNSTIGWIASRRQIETPIALMRVSDGDTNGVVSYLGTNGLKSAFTNPSGAILPTIASSSGSGTPANLTNRTNDEWFTSNAAGSWVAFDLGTGISVSNYTLRARSSAASALPRNWVLEGTNSVSSFDITGVNAAIWTAIDTRTSDATLTAASQYYTLTANGSTLDYRYLRLRITGPDSSGTNFLTLNEIEFYGTYKT